MYQRYFQGNSMSYCIVQTFLQIFILELLWKNQKKLLNYCTWMQILSGNGQIHAQYLTYSFYIDKRYSFILFFILVEFTFFLLYFFNTFSKFRNVYRGLRIFKGKLPAPFLLYSETKPFDNRVYNALHHFKKQLVERKLRFGTWFCHGNRFSL